MGALPAIPKCLPRQPSATQIMIDKNAYRRKVMILEHCLTLARAYHDQDNAEQATYYSLLAREYFEEVLRESGVTERSVAAK